jgi:2-polyprenyl-3-methyl-5-hydroxy-6-metoxy-1,4-benzoquinol methylase
MENQSLDWSEKVRRQFDFAPYPRVPLDISPKEDYNALFIHNLVTPFYLKNRKVIDPTGKLILDLGCGSGYKTLILAEANPGAHIIGIDLSEASIQFARLRLQYYGFKNVEFHTLDIEKLINLGLQFDYINCDEVLYLLPDPVVALNAMKAVLKPEGIIRTNLHSYWQRHSCYRAQKLFNSMGWMENNPEDLEINLVKETMKALRDDVRLKVEAWHTEYELSENSDKTISEILMNHLIQQDKGNDVAQVFSILNQADLEFISMVNWHHWHVANLFQNTQNLPEIWKTILEKATIAEKLSIYELLHPVHRLIDFWCGHPHTTQATVPVSEWPDEIWKTCIAHLHPQLCNDLVKSYLLNCINSSTTFEISRYISLPTQTAVVLDSLPATVLLPLWDGPQPLQTLVERYSKVRSHHLVNLERISAAIAFTEVKSLLRQLESFCYILLQPANS